MDKALKKLIQEFANKLTAYEATNDCKTKLSKCNYTEELENIKVEILWRTKK